MSRFLKILEMFFFVKKRVLYIQYIEVHSSTVASTVVLCTHISLMKYKGFLAFCELRYCFKKLFSYVAWVVPFFSYSRGTVYTSRLVFCLD